MKKIIIFLTLVLSAHLFAFAQSTDDAIRYSFTKNNATARSAAMGGAFGALGGDFSSISINPAGLGVYRAAELTLSTNIRMSNARSNGLKEDKLSLNIDNLGAVFVFSESPSKSGWQGINVAFGYNAINNFNNRSMSGVYNSENSMTDAWAEEAFQNPNNPSEFSAGLAENTHLIAYDEAGQFFFTPLSREDDNYDLVNKHKFIREEGYQGEYVFAVGTNYSNKLYLGLSIGVQHIYYKARANYSEDIPNKYDLDNFNYNEFFKNTGDGINIKFGAIYKATDNLRLGIAYHSPTYYNMREKYYSDVEANFVNPVETFTELSPVNEYEYDFQTPSRTILSGAYIFGRRAILSVDYEYVNYANAEFSEGEFGSIDDRMFLADRNKEIENSLRSTYNLKIGGEYRLNSKVSLRGGYAIYKSPYEEGFINSNSDHKLLSGGIGFRQGNFFMDISYINTKFDEYSVYYNILADDPQFDVVSETVKIKNNFDDFKVTFGFKF